MRESPANLDFFSLILRIFGCNKTTRFKSHNISIMKYKGIYSAAWAHVEAVCDIPQPNLLYGALNLVFKKFKRAAFCTYIVVEAWYN